MLKRYSSHLPKDFDRYIEPLFGGGALFIWAFNKNPNAEFIISDSNVGIMSIYKAVKNDITNFVDKLDKLEDQYLPLSKSDRKVWYYELRHDHAYNYKKWSSTEEAAVLYFLLKTCFNGIWQINKNTNGRFGTPFGLGIQKGSVYNREIVDWWHRALQNTIILDSDFEKVVKKYTTPKSFVFMDPPYRGCFTHYETNFDDNDQIRAVNCLHHCDSLGAHGILTNRDISDDFFEHKWHTGKIHYFDVTYTAGRRKKTQFGFKAKQAREMILVTK